MQARVQAQVLAQLRASDPKLYALLGPEGAGLPFGAEEERELLAAIDSLSRLGLAGPGGDGAQPQQGGGAPEEEGAAARMWESMVQGLGVEGGAPAAGGAKQGSAGAAEVEEEEEELSDAELAQLARDDPDLAALLRSNTLGQDFERMMADEGLELEDGAGADGAGGEEEEPELSDLFDAIDDVSLAVLLMLMPLAPSF